MVQVGQLHLKPAEELGSIICVVLLCHASNTHKLGGHEDSCQHSRKPPRPGNVWQRLNSLKGPEWPAHRAGKVKSKFQKWLQNVGGARTVGLLSRKPEAEPSSLEY